MTSNAQRVLITGARGFVGGALYYYLAGWRVEVYGLDRHAAGYSAPLIAADLLDEDELRCTLREIRPSVIFHLAGAVHTQDASLLHEAHVETTRALLTATKQSAPQARVVVVGSAAEYGSLATTSGVVAEGAAPYPESPYGKSKLLQSQVAKELADSLELDVVRVRLFNTLGPGQGSHLVAGALVKRLHDAIETRLGEFKLFDPYSERDFLDVRDVARLLWLVAQEARARQYGFPIHIASGKKTSVLELAQRLYHVAGITEGVLPLQLLIPDATTSYIAETTTLTRLLHGNTPQKIPLEVSLRDMWQKYLMQWTEIYETEG